MKDSPHPHCSSAILLANTTPSTMEKQSRLTYIRIREHKPLTQLIFHPIHLTPNNAKQRLTINQHLNAILLHRFIKFSRLIHVLQMIC